MDETTNIRKIGKSGAFIYIPKWIMKASGLEIGDEVNIEIDGKTLIIRPIATKTLLPAGEVEA